MIKNELPCGAGPNGPSGVPRKPHPDAAVATLGESERFAHSIVDALSAPIAILNEAGAIIAVNRAWRSFAEANNAPALNVYEGANYLAVCDAALGAEAEQAATFAAAVDAVMRGEQQEFSLEYPCHSPDQQWWFNVSVTRFSHEGAVRVVLFVENITQRKQAEEALRESEERFRIVADNTYDWEFWRGPDERFLYSSPSCERMTGHKPAEFLADPDLLERLIHPDDLSLYEAHYRKVCQARLFGEEEFRIVRPDGTARWIGQVCVPVYGEDGAFLGMRASNRDITERKRDEEVLVESEEHHRSLVASSMDAVLLTVPDGRILAANQPACRMFARSEQELIQMGRSSILDGLDPRLAPALEERARTSQFHGELTLLRKDGTKFPGEISSVIFTDRHGELRTTMVIRDITERKRAEQALREREARFAALFEHNPIRTIVVDLHGRIQAFNRAKRESGDWLPQIGDVLYRDYAGKHTTDMHRELMNCIGSGKLRHYPEQPYGERILSIDIAPFTDGAIITSQDITERKQAEEVLRKLWFQLSQVQDEERRRLARELHDSTGQKLAVLSMTVGLLQGATTAPGGKTEKMFADCLAMIEQCAQEIRTLSYLLHPPLLDELGLAAAIGAYVEGFSKRSGMQVALDVPPGLERLPPEAELALFRVMQESLSNIHRHAGASAARIRLACDAEQVTLEVSDQGRGMSAETIRAIETGSGAAGVGIAGMRERLRLLGGRLEIKSGKCGATVLAIIPRPQEPA